MMAYGAVLLIVASLMTPVASSVWALAIALFVLGLGWNFCFVAGSTLLSGQLHYNERGASKGPTTCLLRWPRVPAACLPARSLPAAACWASVR